MDLLGAFDARGSIPYAEGRSGRSMLRPAPATDPIALLATTTAVWDSSDPHYGAIRGDTLVSATSGGRWECFDAARDPGQSSPQPGATCPALMEAAKKGFAGVDLP